MDTLIFTYSTNGGSIAVTDQSTIFQSHIPTHSRPYDCAELSSLKAACKETVYSTYYAAGLEAIIATASQAKLAANIATILSTSGLPLAAAHISTILAAIHATVIASSSETHRATDHATHIAANHAVIRSAQYST